MPPSLWSGGALSGSQNSSSDRNPVADEWVTQLLRQGDAKVFKKYSQMKLQMKREALEKMNRQASEMTLDSGTGVVQ
jgi:hypothetical protein